MNKLGNLFQVAYLVFAVLFLYKAYETWNTNQQMSYLFIGGAIVAVFKFFFNRKYRKRFEEHYKKREEEKKNK